MFQALFYCLQVALSIGLPIFCMKKFTKDQKAEKRTFLHGALAYLIFGAVISSVVLTLIESALDITSPLLINTWLYCFFNGFVLTACLSLGRVIWIKAIMKKAKSKVDGLVFGTGSALAATTVAYGISGIVSVVFSIMKLMKSTKLIPVIFQSTAEIVVQGSAYTTFLITLQALLVCALEISVAAVFFTSLKGLNSKAFTVPAFIFQVAALSILSSPLSFEIRLIITAAIVLFSTGICWVCTLKKE